MKDDIKIILSLLKYNTDKSINRKLNNININWINVLGYLTYHRVAGLVYEKINFINPRLFDYQFFLTTYLINQAQKIRTIEQQKWINLISEKLNKNNIKHVFLKGAILNFELFSYGSRASNDIDLLISKNDIDMVTKILKSIGFKQGKFDYENNKILEYSENEKKAILNDRGETAPFIKLCNLPVAKTIDVDINFSLDWTSNGTEELVNKFLDNRILIKNPSTGKEIYAPCYEHNFIELCLHFYKDSALIDIIKKRKILDLYKFVDIYYFIMKFCKKININKLYSEISKNKLDSYIFFTLTYIISIFPDAKTEKIKKLLKMLKPKNDILNTIFDQYQPNHKMSTNIDIIERIFSYNLIERYNEVLDDKIN